MRIHVHTLVIAAALAALASAGPAHAAPAGFAFLEVPAGARASAMGGAFTSVGQGVEAVFWNPAGLARVDALQFTAAHFELVEGLRHSQVAFAGQVLGGGLAASMRALYSEPIPERDALGNLIGTFGSHDLEFALGYGAPVAAGVDFGATAQVVRERIANTSATTYAFNAGATWLPPGWTDVRVGMSVHNVGPSTHFTFDGFEGAPVDLPAAIQGGVSYARAIGTTVTARGALEGRFTRGRSGVLMVGAELDTPVGAALRAGFRANDDAQNVSFGAGYASGSLRLDYAWVPYRFDLGDTHRFGITTSF